MDIDDPNEPIGQLSPFSVAFPLPYRVLFLIGVGGLCWATNLHSLEALGIDTLHVLQIRGDKPSLPSSLYGRQYLPHNISSLSYAHSLHPPIYRLLFVYFAWIAAGWLGFAYFTGGSVVDLDTYKLIPIITWLGVIAATMVPVSTVLQAQRSLFYRSVHGQLPQSDSSLQHLSQFPYSFLFLPEESARALRRRDICGYINVIRQSPG
jgi:EXS family